MAPLRYLRQALSLHLFLFQLAWLQSYPCQLLISLVSSSVFLFVILFYFSIFKIDSDYFSQLLQVVYYRLILIYSFLM